MKTTPAQRPAVFVSPSAASVLAQLSAGYGRNLRFRVFSCGFEAPVLRVHDKDYQGDVLLAAGGAPVALCPNAYCHTQSVQIDCRAVGDPTQAFELLLRVNDKLTTILSGGQLVARLMSPAPTAFVVDDETRSSGALAPFAWRG
jgi:hypothetical protein